MLLAPKFFVLVLLLGGLALARAAATNSLVWQTAGDQVSADIRGEALWPLLEGHRAPDRLAYFCGAGH